MRIFRKLAQLLDVDLTTNAPADGDSLTYDSASGKWVPEAVSGGSGGGAPTDADYLVGTANGDLDSEIVVGTSPGGELGGTWASPTVDATHSGSSHASVQAAAEATAAAALSGHASDTTGVHGIADTSALLDTGDVGSTVPAIATFNDHSARHENGGADEISVAGLSGLLADGQTPTAHASSHQDGGTDEISIAGLAGTSVALQAHLDDTADAHDASAISVLDTAANFAGSDVEAVLAELQDNIDAGGGSAASFAQVCYQTAAGANAGGTNAQDAWTKYPVATEVEDADGILALSSSVIVLSAGDYEIDGYAMLYNSSGSSLRLRNTTAGTTLVVGSRSFNKGGSPGGTGGPFIKGRFSVAAAQNLEIQYWCDDAQTTNGLGVSGSDTGEVNVFGSFIFRKL